LGGRVIKESEYPTVRETEDGNKICNPYSREEEGENGRTEEAEKEIIMKVCLIESTRKNNRPAMCVRVWRLQGTLNHVETCSRWCTGVHGWNGDVLGSEASKREREREKTGFGMVGNTSDGMSRVVSTLRVTRSVPCLALLDDMEWIVSGSRAVLILDEVHEQSNEYSCFWLMMHQRGSGPRRVSRPLPAQDSVQNRLRKRTEREPRYPGQLGLD
jgi:hypothetical protein